MISDLFTPSTVAEVEASIYALLESRGIKTANWKPGGVVRTIVAVVAVLAATFSDLVARVASMSFLDTATGDWLRNKAIGDFGVTPFDAAPARGVVRLTNTAGGSFSVDAGDLLVENPATGAQYRNVAPFSLGSLGTVDVEVESTEAGAWTSSDPGTITTMVSTLTGVTVTNPAALVGVDAESDAALRERCRQSPALMSSAGPADAYSYAAKTILRSDGTSTGITRSRTMAGTGDGTIIVVCATPTGTPLSADLTYLQDQMVRQVMTQCATLSVVAADVLPVAVSYTAYTSNAGSDATQDKAAASAALLAYISTVPIGGYRVAGATGTLPRSGLIGAIQSAIPGCFRVDLAVPAADVTMTDSEVATLSTVVASVQVERQQ